MNELVKLNFELKEKIKDIWIIKNEKYSDLWLNKYFNKKKTTLRKSYFESKKDFSINRIPYYVKKDFEDNKKEIDKLVIEAKTIRDNIKYLELSGYTEQTKESNKIIGDRI